MRLVIQRVSRASVEVDGETIGEIAQGLLILVGVGHADDDAICERLAEKVSKLRVFRDRDGKMNASLLDVGGEALVVSQFTLYGDVRKGNRPSFVGAAEPEMAERLVARFADVLSARGVEVSTGRFGAMMQVSLVNDGPVTILIDG